MTGDGFEREVAVEALADQHSEGALALAPAERERRKPAAQERPGSLELVLLGCLAQRLVDELTVDAALQERAPDPLTPPLVEVALVLREQPHEADVVEVALVSESANRRLGHSGVQSLRLEVAAH